MFRQFVSARTHRATTCLFAYVCLFICMQSINQSINQKKRYTDKLKISGVTLPDPSSIDQGLWTEDGPRDVHAGITYKSLEAYNYFFIIIKYVRTVFYYDGICTGTSGYSSRFCILKAKVNPSQRAIDNPNEAWVIINRKNSFVETAHCSCMAWVSHFACQTMSCKLKNMDG